jgi:hypothetical protein
MAVPSSLKQCTKLAALMVATLLSGNNGNNSKFTLDQVKAAVTGIAFSHY